MEEAIIAGCVAIGVFTFFGWSLWATSDRHPERLEKLRQQWGPVPDPIQSEDID